MKVTHNIPADLGRNIPGIMDMAVRKVTMDIQSEAKKRIMSGPKTGRIYDHDGVLHQASAPGESPANDTSNLVNSMIMSKAGAGHYRVDVNAEYAEELENGSRKIAPRPYMLPAINIVMKAFNSFMRIVMHKAGY